MHFFLRHKSMFLKLVLSQNNMPHGFKYFGDEFFMANFFRMKRLSPNLTVLVIPWFHCLTGLSHY